METGNWELEAPGRNTERFNETLPFDTEGKGSLNRWTMVLPGFLFKSSDARFIGSMVDYIIFDGLTGVCDEKNQSIRIVLMDVKKGNSTLTWTQRVIKKAVEKKAIEWETPRIADE
jgi:predicted Holliday junction resolvase-like endonuclease